MGTSRMRDRTIVDVPPLFSLRENAIAQEPGRAILSAGRVCFDSALQWWRRLLRVFPACDPEPGSVFGLITGDPDPGTPSRPRVAPVCNRDLIPADSPHTASGLARRSPLLSSFAEFFHDGTYD